MIGDPICLDGVTARNLNTNHDLAFARLLVEVSVEEAKRTEAILVHSSGEEHVVPVEIEWLPWNCTSCYCFGHSTDFCPKLPRKERLQHGVGRNRRRSQNRYNERFQWLRRWM